ncbi:hypothetical protein CC85DRAFT_260962 [Cutaneotrichosporon oleaginosum]|uniref:Threonylcarbamoyl-AMP synthase n=1 Tax=Cutaneotrichosporon oleaginosum TaxID=879819 RepID=A0A0J1B3A8_9TREE|nr:uncharacterized protein CC85DRAFT_260962 [Cutaneotrichosporon oleaginosum]KLT42104.1 hypothetical protein CC85DRAFT_260962 [Cutaneotrichosporon oleaginosum]TXT04657.1 hypothetical protein COLE_07476 [Cutaneotrichosporon oleaginosum]
MAPSHPKLVWPRSDGREDRWPHSTQPQNSGWFEKLSPEDSKYTLYGEKVGKHIAENVLGLQGLHKPRIDMPPGYALFRHKKPQPDKSIREDVYLYGSPVSKFRSPNEFIEHAVWLFDTSKSLKDHSTCECKYNSKSAIAQEKKASTPAKRANDGSTPGSKKSRVEEDEVHDAVVVPERTIDQLTKRRYRKGELVFFRIHTISPPKGSDLPEVTHWPGLIATITQASKVDENGKPVTTFKHSIRPLGMFSNANMNEVVKYTSELLPFSTSVQLLGGAQGWTKIGRESSRVLREGIEREAQIDIPSHQTEIEGTKLEERWKRRWGERIKFSDMPNSWDRAVLRLGVALRMARNIASCWAHTDMFETLPRGTALTQAELNDIQNRKKNLYQGAWYQGERLWMDDVVRLRKNRKDLPVDVLLPPSPGAEDRGVFLRIRIIALESQTAADASTTVWRCVIYGDIYELANAYAPGAPPNWPAPKGLHYRRLNKDGFEVSVDLFDVAGRAYPDLMEKNSAWFYDPNVPESERNGRVPASDGILEIIGLRPASRPCECSVWKGDLYVMVREATADVERSTREHYGKLLAKALKYPSTPVNPPNGALSNGSSSHGSSKTPVFQCNVVDVTITPSLGNRLQSPTISAGPNLRPALDIAASHLKAGRTVAFPTETVYGLGAHSLDPSATAKIYAIKNRPSDNPLIMHVSSLDMLQRLLPPSYQLSELYHALIAAYWPGPLTLLFPSATPPPPPAPQTNAIRMPNHPLALALIAAADLPVSAPSANSSGRPSPTRAQHVVHDLDGREGLGCILDGGPCGVGVESTVVDGLGWQKGGGGVVNVLRPGGLGVEDIARVVAQVDGRPDATAIQLQGRPWVKGQAGGGVPKPTDDSLPPSTPGMKYRHYSPTVPVQLLLPSNVFPRPPVVGATTDAAGVVRALVGDKRVGLLHYEGSPLTKALEGVPLERRSLGLDATSAAQHLFDALLDLESAGVDAILVEGCSDDGLGLAVMERVGKAVGGGGVTGGLDNGQVSTPGSEGRFWVQV